jgi:uncharacterized protein
MVRIPGWAREIILSGGLYGFEQPRAGAPVLAVNGEPIAIALEKGYAVIDREWKAGDTLDLALPLAVRKIMSDSRLIDNRGKAALQRGPIVYCVEGRDADRPLESIRLGDESGLTVESAPALPGGLTVIRGPGFTAIPYFAWANRGPGPMRVWLST